MTLRNIKVSALTFVLFACFFAFGMARPAGSEAAVRLTPIAKTVAVEPPTTWVFEGCWTRYQIGPCLDVYADESGNYWICKDCGTTVNPGPNKCTQTSAIALSRGFWCS
jgi:hypothetical protein